MESLNQERFTKKDVRDLVDVATPKRKVLYMTLKDSGMRIGEAVQLRKEDIDLATNPVRITIHRSYTKTSSDRTTYVTRETKPYLEKLLVRTKEGALVFGCNEDVEKSVACEDITFRRMRELTGLTEKYKDTNRYKKTLHGFRKFCATQLEERWDKDFGHKILGHKRYLDTYFLNDDTAEKYLKAENNLMVFTTIEFDELDYEQMKSEIEANMEVKMQKMYKLLQGISGN